MKRLAIIAVVSASFMGVGATVHAVNSNPLPSSSSVATSVPCIAAKGNLCATAVSNPSLTEIDSQPDVAGVVGPMVLPDGTQVAVIARSVDSMAMTGRVELAVDHEGSWLVAQTLDVGFPDAPAMTGDLTGDGVTEIVVTMIGSTGGKSWDVIYRIDPAGPTLEEIPFAVNELEPLLGTLPFGLTIDAVQPDTVSTSVRTCQPSCADDQGTPVDWYLDRSGSWILRPQPTNQSATPQPASGDTVDVQVHLYYSAWDSDEGTDVVFGDCGFEELDRASPGTSLTVADTDIQRPDNVAIFEADPWLPSSEIDECGFDTRALTVGMTDENYMVGNDVIGYVQVSPEGIVHSGGRPELFVSINVDIDSNSIRDWQTYDGNDHCGC